MYRVRCKRSGDVDPFGTTQGAREHLRFPFGGKVARLQCHGEVLGALYGVYSRAVGVTRFNLWQTVLIIPVE